MKTHLDNLLFYIPDILDGKILDIGSGRGSFLIEVAKRGGNVQGIERKKENIEISFEKANELGVKINVVLGFAEELPYEDSTFDFINVCEVIEHVKDPKMLLFEAYRVLKKRGRAYLSVPNRFGVKDQHFQLYFVN